MADKQSTTLVTNTETPFDKRYCCWFCGEPSSKCFSFPSNTSIQYYSEKAYLVLSCPHPILSVPSCLECFKVASKAKVNSIWAVKSQVKRYLIKHYQKDLSIGINWTQQELLESEFEHGNFSGFQRSAWFMYEVAKARVNFSGWPLVLNGLELGHDEQQTSFIFDGVCYPSIDEAMNHYAKTFFLDKNYFSAVLQQLAKNSLTVSSIEQKEFAQAVRFCRLLVGSTPNELKLAFKQLIE